MALVGHSSAWSVRKARLALRQADRAMAQGEDPRVETLASLPAQIRKPRPRTRPNRVRYRCSQCFAEALFHESDLEYIEERHRCGVPWEPVVRRKPPSPSTSSPDTKGETG